MRRIVLLIASAAILAAPLRAARLCHDLKGLYTPCPPETARETREAHEPPAAAQSADVEPKTSRPPPPTASSNREKTARIAVRTKHCHDLKGLYTPCAR